MEIKLENPKLGAASNGQAIAMLKEENGTRILTIVLHIVSFHLLRLEIDDIDTPQPMIFEFVSDCLNALKGSLEKVVIYDMVDGLYLSRAVIKDIKEDRTYSLDLFVVNALALAIATERPIFVVEEVFEKVAKEQKELEEKARQEIGAAMLDGLNLKKETRH